MTSRLSTETSTLNDSISYQNRINGSRPARNDLPPEPLSKYYEERKKIIFRKKDVNINENFYLNLLKKSQLLLNTYYFKRHIYLVDFLLNKQKLFHNSR